MSDTSQPCACLVPSNFVNMKVLRRPGEKTKVFIRFVGTNCCDVSVDKYLNTMREVYAEKSLFLVLYDATQVGRLPLTTINKVASFMRTFDASTRLYLKGCAIVLSSEWAKASLNVLFTLKPPACPLQTFTSVDEAKLWLRHV